MSKNYRLKIFIALGVLFILCLGGFFIFTSNDSENKAETKTETKPIMPTSAASSVAPSPVAEPKTEEAVQAKMQTLFDLRSTENYELAYNMYASDVKKIISKADYVKYFKACNVREVGTKYTISNIKINDDKATFEVQSGIYSTTAIRTSIYEDGAWRLKMTSVALNPFKSGVDIAIAHEKSNGNC